ncbi:GerAB/ArcD/ProY family transporter [Cohnella faecalis]|uniref:Uncharacterized protein n=1 Tax=Cohnella faecalis TaxID=2315694 RepID=A0A398CNL1_9BACL|nr:GerAB/ArcD/ProY family transporter [Cohnella faecalis]RIE03912.1 hypothetical protein D3H35_08070 [Cohnella faecalis]
MLRYLYYHVLYVGMINIMLFVPHVLIEYRFKGAVSGMALAMVVGSIVAIGTSVCFRRFPGLGMYEIFDCFLPGWLTKILSSYSALTWALGGLLVVYIQAELIRTFFNPDMNEYWNLLIMVIAALWASTRSIRTVQFAQEILILMCAPLIFMILFKAIGNEWLNWDAIRLAAGYVRTKPSFVSFCAATFLFSGYLNLIVFNRMATAKTSNRYLWIIPIFGVFFMLVTFFVPIGFHGTAGIDKYVFLWSTTADSMEMQYGFINRVLYLFLVLYTNLSLIFVMNAWHVTIDILHSVFTGKVMPVDPSSTPADIGISLLRWASPRLFTPASLTMSGTSESRSTG